MVTHVSSVSILPRSPHLHPSWQSPHLKDGGCFLWGPRFGTGSKQSKFAPQKHHPCPSLSTWSWCNKGVCVCVLIWAPWFGWACPTISMQLQVSLTNSVQGNPQPASKMGRGFVCFWFYIMCSSDSVIILLFFSKSPMLNEDVYHNLDIYCATLSILNRCTFVQGKSRLREASHNLPNGPYDDKRYGTF